MEQIKIFSNFDIDILETEVNDWLKNNPNIDIMSRRFSSSFATFKGGNGAGIIYHNVVIFFKEKKKTGNKKGGEN